MLCCNWKTIIKGEGGRGRERGETMTTEATLKLYLLKCTWSQLLQPREGGMKTGRKAGGREREFREGGREWVAERREYKE